jgi:bacteriocin biosynthesis cyclodehydratase domain-containing protein
MSARRLRFAMPFGTAIEPGCVHLIGGEDVRFTLRAPELEEWLPALLQRLARGESDSALIGSLPERRREAARELFEQLIGERVLVRDAEPEREGRSWALEVDVVGEGRLAERVRARLPLAEERVSAPDEAGQAGERLLVLCQDTLDYRAGREQSAELRCAGRAQIWVSSGPIARALVSPLFLPEASPCFECLLSHFLRLSRAPDLTRALYTSGLELLDGGAEAFSDRALGMVAELVASKCALATELEPAAALFRLHAFELATLEVSSHPVSPDPECPVCS